ncbi:glycerophosphodiester phosphodiesterase [Exiguobacterium sp. B2(2022)]|uniref:glycerophosphodiester phosphodiesterase n=1 Tax=Exiguobacterium sp. B2(2022) TaxID=2992755 RepID=UPI00237ABC23|nr:glycerophosphodiester phosphodiesterase [Exiguobacterium sp. B2(2022)]MDE0562933.1 glycerophosphodiester phosphodiesterase [Exiguobacterium sp. B2(2022)]
MKRFAHRGVMALQPENTMSAFRLALDAGADGIETDVHLTKDDELVLIHDETLERTTDGSGLVSSYTLDELRRFNAGVRSSQQEVIPTLQELLELVRDESIRLNLEVKTDVLRYVGIESRLLDTIESSGINPSRILFSSFNHETVHRLKKMRPDIEAAILLAQPLYDTVGYLESVGADSVHPHIDRITNEEIQSLQRHGVPVRPYTIKTEAQLDRCRTLQVDAIFVNDIEWASKTL